MARFKEYFGRFEPAESDGVSLEEFGIEANAFRVDNVLLEIDNIESASPSIYEGCTQVCTKAGNYYILEVSYDDLKKDIIDK